jgi:peroxiredoxin Q/BCP
MMLQIGKPAPKFSLPDADMNMVNLADFKGKTVVLYFYPKDDTPGCTLQAIEFTDLEQELNDHNCVVLGVSRDDCMSHAAFRDKHGLAVRLLADTETEVCQKYEVWREKEVDGQHRMGILRSTFIIDGQGILRYAMRNVTPRGHAQSVLELIKQMD